MLKDWNFWLSVITASVAVLALFQSAKQTSLSNKQHLFDKRVENYLIAMGLVQLYRENSIHLKHDEDKPILTIDLEFSWLTNNSYMENIASAISNPLQEPHHKDFLVKLENLKKIGTKIKLLFSDKPSNLLGEFVVSYQELLFTMYQYQIVINKMSELSEKLKISLEESQDRIGERKHKEKLQKSLKKLENANIELINNHVEEQIKNQIKLK